MQEPVRHLHNTITSAYASGRLFARDGSREALATREPCTIQHCSSNSIWKQVTVGQHVCEVGFTEWATLHTRLAAAKDGEHAEVGAGVGQDPHPGLGHAAAPGHVQLLQAVPA